MHMLLAVKYAFTSGFLQICLKDNLNIHLRLVSERGCFFSPFLTKKALPLFRSCGDSDLKI